MPQAGTSAIKARHLPNLVVLLFAADPTPCPAPLWADACPQRILGNRESRDAESAMSQRSLRNDGEADRRDAGSMTSHRAPLLPLAPPCSRRDQTSSYGSTVLLTSTRCEARELRGARSGFLIQPKGAGLAFPESADASPAGAAWAMRVQPIGSSTESALQ